VSNVAPAGAVAGGLVIVVAYAGLRFVTAAVNAIIRILFAMGRERVLPRSLSRLSRHSAPGSAIISGSAAICSYRRRPLFSCCFPLRILHPHGRTLMDLLPFAALGWLCLGVIVASTLRTRLLAESPAQG